MYKHDGKWDPRKEHENASEEAHHHAEHDHHDHPPHYHGGPLQWMAHSKNF